MVISTAMGESGLPLCVQVRGQGRDAAEADFRGRHHHIRVPAGNFFNFLLEWALGACFVFWMPLEEVDASIWLTYRFALARRPR